MTASESPISNGRLGGPPPRRQLLRRFVAFSVVVAIVVGALGTRMFYLQISQGEHYAGLARQNRVTLEPVRAPRGLIVDREGRTLVTNVPVYTVRVRPADLPMSQREDVIGRLSELLTIQPSTIREALDRYAGSRFESVSIQSDVPVDLAGIIKESQLPGVEVAVEAQRDYPYGSLVSHVLGYTGAVTQAELERVQSLGYLNDDTIGKAGVEVTFEEELRGQYGVQEVERDAAGRPIEVLGYLQEPRSGNSLELTIDLDIQRDAQRALQWGMGVIGSTRGVVMVMNPQTGEILAMVSLPAYDNNLFAGGISNAQYQELLEDPDRPLINAAIGDHFPPGSTYKLVTGTGGLADGLITDRTKLNTKAYLTINGYRYYEWDRRGWGPLDIYDGFGHSSDTYFFQVAGMLGIDRLAEWAHDYGFGQRSGIALPGEVSGIIPDTEWKKRVFNQPIYPGETYQAAIGQGYDTATPLQVLNAYATLANGGKVMVPQIVRRVIGPDGEVVQDFAPQIDHQLAADPETLEAMRVAARRVLTLRHTYNLVDLPMVVAGKSGTAENGLRDAQGRLPFHSWFAAFVPAFGPGQRGDVRKTDAELAVVALAYDSRTKGNAATEIVKYFLQLHYDVKKDLRRPDLLQRGNFYGGQ